MKFAEILLLSGFLFLSFSLQASHFPYNLKNQINLTDTINYRGYRLEMLDFKLLKEKNDWIKISCTIINSGRNDIDMGKDGTEHWVLINFDQSIFTAKLGGYRNNIRQQLAQENFTLPAGRSVKDFELKISSIIQSSSISEPPIASTNPAPSNRGDLSWEPSTPPSLPKKSAIKDESCPDILISSIKILEENEKWATIEYTFTNQGDGTFYLYGKGDGKKDNLVINAFISGVTELTRGAIPIGGQIFPESDDIPNELVRGDTITAQLKLDIRKKTRYMKSLILSLDSNQFVDECDRINNHMGVVLR